MCCVRLSAPGRLLCNSLGAGFSLCQCRGNGGSRLGDEKGLVTLPSGFDFTLVLVTPEHQIQEARQHRLGDVACFRMLDPVLMQDKEVEPGLLTLVRLLKHHLLLAPCPVQPLIADAAQAVYTEMSFACKSGK